MPEEQHDDSQQDDELQVDEEVMEDLDTSPEQSEDVKGGVASADPFISRGCGN